MKLRYSRIYNFFPLIASLIFVDLFRPLNALLASDPQSIGCKALALCNLQTCFADLV